MENNYNDYDIFKPYICNALQRNPVEQLTNRAPLSVNERIAFPHPNSIKRATLLADRIYLPCWSSEFHGIPTELTYGNLQVDQQTANASWMYAEVAWPMKIKDIKKREEEYLNIFLKAPIERYRAKFPNANIFPLNYQVGSSVIPLGKSQAIEATLNNIPIVIESSLEWEQILDFRKDSESKRKYRDLHLWLEMNEGIKSLQHATDLIGQKIEDYQFAINKHGLKTKIEAISSMLSLGSVVPAAGGFLAKATEINPVVGAIIGGILAIGGASAWVAKRSLDLKDLKRGQHREIAYIYDIKKMIK